jgi:pre-mRNA-splicing factor SPF27
MSLHVQHASLPYYDPALTDEQQDSIDSLLDPLLPQTSKLHPFVTSLPSPPEPSPFWSAEYSRLARNKPLNAINLNSYQLSNDTKTNLVASEFFVNRSDNLALLETYGSNAWLIGNAIQEHSLGVLESELARLKEEGVGVNRERKRENLEFGGEIGKLEGRWRKALRGVVEVEIGCALLEEEVHQLRAQSERQEQQQQQQQ